MTLLPECHSVVAFDPDATQIELAEYKVTRVAEMTCEQRERLLGYKDDMSAAERRVLLRDAPRILNDENTYSKGIDACGTFGEAMKKVKGAAAEAQRCGVERYTCEEMVTPSLEDDLWRNKTLCRYPTAVWLDRHIGGTAPWKTPAWVKSAKRISRGRFQAIHGQLLNVLRMQEEDSFDMVSVSFYLDDLNRQETIEVLRELYRVTPVVIIRQMNSWHDIPQMTEPWFHVDREEEATGLYEGAYILRRREGFHEYINTLAKDARSMITRATREQVISIYTAYPGILGQLVSRVKTRHHMKRLNYIMSCCLDGGYINDVQDTIRSMQGDPDAAPSIGTLAIRAALERWSTELSIAEVTGALAAFWACFWSNSRWAGITNDLLVLAIGNGPMADVLSGTRLGMQLFYSLDR